MSYLLDTNMVIAILKRQERLTARLKRHSPTDFFLPSIVYHELAFGAYNSKRIQSNLELIEALQFQVLEFSKSDAEASGRIRADLKGQGTPIGPYDVLIAGQAVARDLVLLTNNLREFRRVSGLKVEDWSVSQK